MKTTCVCVIAALLLSAPILLWSQNNTVGPEIFKARCGTCHGKDGQGLASAKIPPIKGTSLTVEKLTKFITEGGGGKIVHYSPIVNISVDEAKAVAEYVKSLK